MTNLEYIVVRSSRRRKLTISVERDRKVVVHAPDKASDEEIGRIVESKKRWILDKISHPQKYKSLPHPPGKELVNGESALYLGRDYRIELSDRDGSEVEFAQKFLVPGSTHTRRREALRRWYEACATEVILPRVQHYAKELGVNCEEAKISDNRYRWGSCTKNGNVSFNWRLIKAPMMAINYVVVHELAHLLEPNHTARFWNIIRSQLASSDKARQWLKEHGEILETEL